jgi:hypothetical protein
MINRFARTKKAQANSGFLPLAFITQIRMTSRLAIRPFSNPNHQTGN